MDLTGARAEKLTRTGNSKVQSLTVCWRRWKPYETILVNGYCPAVQNPARSSLHCRLCDLVLLTDKYDGELLAP